MKHFNIQFQNPPSLVFLEEKYFETISRSKRRRFLCPESRSVIAITDRDHRSIILVGHPANCDKGNE